MMNNSGLPVRSLTKAMLRPSGDHAGSPSSLVCRVNRRTPCPSGRILKISALPVRSLTKAMLRPSGDQAGRRRAAVSGQPAYFMAVGPHDEDFGVACPVADERN